MKTTYAQARADFEALERLVQLSDQMELDAEREPLMRNPTKAHAANLYQAGIRMWFREHATWALEQDAEKVSEIAARYRIEL